MSADIPPKDLSSETNSVTIDSTPTAKKLSRLQAGMIVDDYQLEEKLHTGGMAALWRITDLRQRHSNSDGSFPALIMKVPLMFSIDDPTAIVAFEVEQMIMPKLKGQHVPNTLQQVILIRNHLS